MFSMASVSLLFDKFKVYIVLFLLVVMAAMFVFYNTRIHLLEKSLEDEQRRNGELVIENSALHSANVKMAGDIEIQNTAIDKLRLAGEEQDRLAKEAMADVRKEAAIWKDKYAKLFNVPPASKDECSNVQSLVYRYWATRVEEAKGETK